ncbi:shc sh2 domain-binding protein 1-like protein [Lasius niger]|uniref:Shc sh2 domain-binding protein 1-like protein n=1 Tax=Lasius niger TaxID=67767 RepID=A0A0J7P2B6_LASNI|nr:shc sh2 domain-binding protein 1-like protein [Lasius niger]
MPPNIRAEWAYDLETVMEKVGWEALWKISRPMCESFNIPYPVIVLVEVLGMDFSKLNAIVKVKAVLDNNIHLPEKHEVPLIELYPTISQKNRTLDIEGTAHCVDRVRFFYHYLWMPWDEEEDDDTTWVRQHLESRLKLYYDMKNKVINDETCEIIRSLIKEAKEVKKKISIYEALLPEDMHEDEIPKELAKEAFGLMKFHFRLQQIKAEMDLLENPSLRKLLGHNQSFVRREKRKDGKNIYYFVWLGGVVKQLQELSIKIQTMLPENAPIKISGCLDDALDTIEPGDTVLLSEGHHSVKRYNELQKGGTIIGICNVENTVLCPIESDVLLALLDFSGTEVLLKNICIDLGTLQAGIIVRKDCTVIVTDCRIRVSNIPSNTKWGTIVMPGGKLVFENTVFQGLGTAAIIYATGEVVMNKCNFEDCYEGIRLSDNAIFSASNCSFENITHEQAIVMETDKVFSSKSVEVGSEIANIFLKKIILNECKFPNDGKGNVMLKPKGIVAFARAYAQDKEIAGSSSREGNFEQ